VGAETEREAGEDAQSAPGGEEEGDQPGGKGQQVPFGISIGFELLNSFKLEFQNRINHIERCEGNKGNHKDCGDQDDPNHSF